MTSRKEFLLALGERSGNPPETDELLKSKISERKRKEIARQEEEDEAAHKAKMAKLKKEETGAEAAIERSSEKKEESSGFKVTGGVNLGNIDLQADRQAAIQELKDLKKEQEETLKAVGQENQQLRDRIHQQEMKVIATTFEAALSTLKDKLDSKGTITEQVAGIRAMAKELGMTQPDPGVSDPGLQIQMLQLQHQEAQRQREFEWQMQKDREEREDRKEERLDKKAEVAGQLQLQREKNEMFAKAPEIVGTAIGKAIADGGGEADRVATSPSSKGSIPIITAGVGEGGEVECGQCKQPVAVGPTARVAECAGCGAKYSIKRVQAETQGESEEE